MYTHPRCEWMYTIGKDAHHEGRRSYARGWSGRHRRTLTAAGLVRGEQAVGLPGCDGPPRALGLRRGLVQVGAGGQGVPPRRGRVQCELMAVAGVATAAVVGAAAGAGAGGSAGAVLVVIATEI